MCTLHFCKKLLLDPCADSITKQNAIRHHDTAAPAIIKLADHKLKEQPGSLRCLLVGREVSLDTQFFGRSKRRVGYDNFDSSGAYAILHDRF